MEKLIVEKNIDGILITNYYNIRYLSNFTGSNSLLLITKNRRYFFTDFRYYGQAYKEIEKGKYKIIESSGNFINDLIPILKKENIKYIGIESLDLTVSRLNLFKENIKNVEFVSLLNEIKLMRMVKTDKEIENIKQAVKIADDSFTEILNYVEDGITEKELAYNLEYIMRKKGADDRSFDTIIASGSNSAMPHAKPTNKIIERNKFILFDFGAYYNGYVSDITRTIFFGNDIDKEHEKVYNIVKEAQELGVKNICSGKKSSEIDLLVRNYIKSEGYGDKFGHSLGHGIGLEIHELPNLSQYSDIILEKNMVCTVEPGIYIEGFGGVRIEDDVVVTDSGCSILNETSKELIIIK